MTNDQYICRVKNLFIYTILVVTLLSSASGGQFLKLPILISHFLEHQHKDKSIGFLDFLTMHYGSEDDNDNDHDRDMQLPFKSASQHCCNPIPSLLVMPVAMVKQKQFPEKLEFAVLDESMLVDPAHASLFRPPRV